MSIRGPKLKVFVGVMSIVCIALGIYLNFFYSRGFVKTTATIVSLEEVEDPADNERREFPVVEYTVDGKTYTERLDESGPNDKIGKTVKVLYDPENPGVVHSGSGLSVYVLVLGVAMLAFVIISSIREKKSQEQARVLRQERGRQSYAPSMQGEERELYFLTDLGTPKYGHRLEDADRHVLYEAKMTKFTLTQPFGFDFIDHEHGTVTPHLVGHNEESEWSTLLIDNHYTFELNGEDIWKHLKKNGITVESRYDSGNGRLVGMHYNILRDGVEIAQAETTSRYPHEEDEAQHKVAGAIPAQGFYRVWTDEANLDLLFMTLVAFARSGAGDGRGGNYGAIAGTLKDGLKR
ncbi:MAG: DUF3592 domain-containing protein [Lachnospiraceae bacterium]|nr:DUF3592 domain-containing protein [Lachnospiraceae bacterium]